MPSGHHSEPPQRRHISDLEVWTSFIDSWMLLSFPPLFDEFYGRRFVLLWRGSRDGFGAGDFHGRCDGHANTLTLILDTSGNVFGCFTRLEWESRVWNGEHDDKNNMPKCDDSLKSFIFMLKNPRNTAARKFALKTNRRQYAILCDSNSGPTFGYGGPDICIYENCQADTDSSTWYFGKTYTNGTGLDGETFFIGSENFTVKEIELFEIID
jgi:hypothetical protein